jgi:hypothetical protein
MRERQERNESRCGVSGVVRGERSIQLPEVIPMSNRRQQRPRVRSGFWAGHAALTCILMAACVGQIGNQGGPVSGSDGGPGVGTGEGASGSGGSPGGMPAKDAGVPAVPFEPLLVPASVTKVKTMLTGLAPTQAEIDAVTANPSALSGLVTTWMALPQYTAKMELFFADAFQQSQSQASGFSSIDQGNGDPFDELLLNFRQGFAKTVTQLVAEGKPFTQTVTTTRYMMTTAMMTYYAYADSGMTTDETAAGPGGGICRFFDDDPNWSFQLTAQPVSLADTGNPASPNYLTYSIPNLALQYSVGSAGESDAPPGPWPSCASYDPVVMNGSASFSGGDDLCNWLYSVMHGTNFWFGPNFSEYGQICYGGSIFQDTPSYPRAFVASDYTDWRMVTISQTTSLAEQTRFFDIVGNRASNTLTLFEPRVGYFTTPAFFSQYPTNISNQARVTADQTMIVGLGQAFNGTDPITVPNAPGLDPVHAANPACFQCHWSLDPMARFFRSNLTTSYSTQQDPAQIAIPGTFLFDNVVGNADTTLYYLASQIASHPQFKTAWTQKLCGWANSGTCLASDPEVQRIAQVFASSNYNWNTLVHELFTSPLVTYTSPTLSTQTIGTIVPIARRAQLCATLNSRLGLTDVCGFNFIPLVYGTSGSTSALPSPGNDDCAYETTVVCAGAPCTCTGTSPDPGPVPPAAAELPTDGYTRGAATALYINSPDPFWRSALEQICANVADVVVDSGATALYSSSTPASVTTSIASMVHGLMGLDSSRDAQPISILTSHYASARAAGHTPTDALKSTFTAACVSPVVAAVGE